MGASKRKKVVIDYFKTIGVNKIEDIEGELKKTLGSEAALPVIKKWYELNPEKNDTETVHLAGLHTEKERAIDQTELYDFIHLNYVTSMIFDSFTDADIFFQVCNWINDHRSLFSGPILDIGCGTGIVTCFIALIFPESRIIGVDRSQNSIAIANELNDKLGLSNVSFIYDVLGDSVGNDFSTVFSSRTVHENTGKKFTKYRYMSFDEQIAVYSKLYYEYAGIIANRVAEGGCFISFERFNSCDTDYYSYLKALNSNGLRPDFDFYTIIEAKESNLVSKSKFTITVAEKAEERAVGELFASWSQHAFINTLDINRFTAPQIDYYIREFAEKVRFGFISYDVNPDAQSIRCVVYDIKDDPSHFLMHQENGLESRLEVFDNSDEFEARMVFENNKRQDKRNGFTVVEIEPGSKY